MIGSSAFPITPALAAQIRDILLALPEPVVLLTRGRGNVDEFITRVAPILGIRCFMYPSKGGSDNWQRDIELVTDADEVIAFFASSTLPDVTTGTAHLVERALDKKKPVRAFTEINDSLVFAGEWP